MNATDFIQLLILVIAILGLMFTILSFRQQLRQNFFTDYTKRYQKIMLHLPEEFYTNEVTYKELQNEARAYLRAYFDLCSEEYYLKTSGKIDKEVWENWKQGIVYIFNKELILEAWSHFNQENYQDFSKWISTKVIKK